MQAMTSNTPDQEKPELDDVVSDIASAALFRSTDCHGFNRRDDSQLRACVEAADPDVRKTAFAIADYLHTQATDKAGTTLYLLSLALSPSGAGADLQGPDLVSDYDTTLCKVSLMRLTLKDLVVDLRVYGDGFCNLTFTLPNGNTFDPRSVQNAVNTIMHVDGMSRIDSAYRYPRVEDLSIAPLVTLAYKLMLADAGLGFQSLDCLRFSLDDEEAYDLCGADDLVDKDIPELRDLLTSLLNAGDTTITEADVMALDRVALIYAITDITYSMSDEDDDEEEEDEEEDDFDEYDEAAEEEEEKDDFDESEIGARAPEDADCDEEDPWTVAEMRKVLVRNSYLTASDCEAKTDAEIEELFNSIPAYNQAQ